MGETGKSPFVRNYTSPDGAVWTEHRDGQAWWEVPCPPADHECWTQTRGQSSPGEWVFRCGCGAISGNGVVWDERNSRSALEKRGQLPRPGRPSRPAAPERVSFWRSLFAGAARLLTFGRGGR